MFDRAEYELMVLGNTKAGKTTYLNHLLGTPGLLKSDTAKATSFFWNL
jgi:GTPase Era involved in 16S rRNA processing